MKKILIGLAVIILILLGTWAYNQVYQPPNPWPLHERVQIEGWPFPVQVNGLNVQSDGAIDELLKSYEGIIIRHVTGEIHVYDVKFPAVTSIDELNTIADQLREKEHIVGVSYIYFSVTE